jgi:hypothetical protein
MGYEGETRYLTPVEVHPQLSYNRQHPMDGVLVGCWFTIAQKLPYELDVQIIIIIRGSL